MHRTYAQFVATCGVLVELMLDVLCSGGTVQWSWVKKWLDEKAMCTMYAQLVRKDGEIRMRTAELLVAPTSD